MTLVVLLVTSSAGLMKVIPWNLMSMSSVAMMCKLQVKCHCLADQGCAQLLFGLMWGVKLMKKRRATEEFGVFVDGCCLMALGCLLNLIFCFGETTCFDFLQNKNRR